jgi:DNA-binding LacI/PurR family transcriptional regulator
VIHSDPDALSVQQYCEEVGIRIPEDLAVVAYDDEVANLAQPAMTAVRPPKHQVGRLAVEMMVARLVEGKRRPTQRVLVVPELVIRSSSVVLADALEPSRPAATGENA